MELKKSIRVARALSGKNKTDFAEGCGDLSASRIYQMEKANACHTDNLIKLSKGSNMKVSEFIALSE